MEEDTEQAIIKIPTIRLSKILLRELCDILNNEYTELKKTEKDYVYWLSFEMTTTAKKIQTANSDSFLKYDLPHTFIEIELTLHSKDKSINITFYEPSFLPSQFTVGGTDSVWVNGLTRQFEEIFQKHKTSNHFYHSKKSWLLFLGLTITVLIGTYLLVDPFGSLLDLADTTEDIDSSIIALLTILRTAAMSGSALSYLLWENVFRWLFPIIEVENSIQLRVRQKIVILLLAVVGSIIGGGISSLILSS